MKLTTTIRPSPWILQLCRCGSWFFRLATDVRRHCEDCASIGEQRPLGLA